MAAGDGWDGWGGWLAAGLVAAASRLVSCFVLLWPTEAKRRDVRSRGPQASALHSATRYQPW